MLDPLKVMGFYSILKRQLFASGIEEESVGGKIRIVEDGKEGNG